jgi:hypothetical protein
MCIHAGPATLPMAPASQVVWTHFFDVALRLLLHKFAKYFLNVDSSLKKFGQFKNFQHCFSLQQLPCSSFLFSRKKHGFVCPSWNNWEYDFQIL